VAIEEEVDGKYTVTREYSYIVVDGMKVQVAVRELERKNKLEVVARALSFWLLGLLWKLAWASSSATSLLSVARWELHSRTP